LIGGEAAAAAAAAVVGEEEVRAYPLSDDQTPYRKDERERVTKCGARVMSMDQIAGDEPQQERRGAV
jgi:cGMP-dependent protein kinase